MTANVRPLASILACLLGPAVWALHFFVVYGAESIVCLGASSPAMAMRWTVVCLTAVAIAAVALPMVRWLRGPGSARAGISQFLAVLAGWLAALSAAAILGTAWSGLRLPPCTSPFG